MRTSCDVHKCASLFRGCGVPVAATIKFGSRKNYATFDCHCNQRRNRDVPRTLRGAGLGMAMFAVKARSGALDCYCGSVCKDCSGHGYPQGMCALYIAIDVCVIFTKRSTFLH